MAGTLNKDRDWKKFTAKMAFAGIAVGAAYVLGSPEDQSLEEGRTYAPNPVQQEFMRLAAQKYDYVALGDTDHGRPEVSIFAFHQDTIAALADGGDTHVFMEAEPAAIQTYIMRMQSNPANADYPGAFRFSDTSSWICNAESREATNLAFEQSVLANPDVQFIGVDQRLNDDSSNSLANNWHLGLTLGPFAMASHVLHGCITSNMLVPGVLLYAATGGKLSNSLLNDYETANAIMNASENGGTIIYGAGHFEAGETHLGNILKDNGHSLVNINVYSGGTLQNPPAREDADEHAALMVYHEGDATHGIRTYTPEMEAMYQQALKNTSANAPAPFPGS